MDIKERYNARMQDVAARSKFVRAATAIGIIMTIASSLFGLFGHVEESLQAIIAACFFFWRANVIGSKNVR
jgi:hypothetical protein